MVSIRSRCTIHYGRELYDLADVLFHADVWSVLVGRTGIGIVFAKGTECAFRKLSFSQRWFSHYGRRWRFPVLDDTRPERLNDDIAKLIFPRSMAFMVGLAFPVGAFLFWWYHWRARDFTNLVVITLGPLSAIRMFFLGCCPTLMQSFTMALVLLGFCCCCSPSRFPRTAGATIRACEKQSFCYALPSALG
jgi:hypothetical protein